MSSPNQPLPNMPRLHLDAQIQGAIVGEKDYTISTVADAGDISKLSMANAETVIVANLATEITLLRTSVEELTMTIQALLPALPAREAVELREISKDQAKNEILELFSEDKVLHYDELAETLRLDLRFVVEVCNELVSEGKIGEAR